MFNNINTRSVTFNIIVINFLFWFATMGHKEFMTDHLSLHYLYNTHHYQFEYSDGQLTDAIGFQPYQLITHMFMHGGWMHIIFNMWGLFMFGTILEQVWGPRRFLIFYFVTGFGAVLLHMGVQLFLVHRALGTYDPGIEALHENAAALQVYVSQTLGASGAIFGIATGFAMLFPNTELMIIPIPIPIKAKYLMPVYIAIEIYSGVSNRGGDNVAHFAHLGGALFGALLVLYWNRRKDVLY